MAKDFFADITPPSPAPQDRRDPLPQQGPVVSPPERSIRQISVPVRRMPDMRPPVSEGGRTGSPGAEPPQRTKRYRIWGVAALSLLLVGGAAAYVFSGATEITITPRTHAVTFTPETQFTATRDGDAGITYVLDEKTFEEYASVTASGTEVVRERASGTITVYNEYSGTSVRLIKNTRFQASDGRIFRIPASVEVPGGKQGAPGTIDVTVFADEAGPEYNVAPGRFNVPGLKNTPAMFAGVYARSQATFTGGFIGERPAVSEEDARRARAELRQRIPAKATEETAPAPGLVFPGLISIHFEDLPARMSDSQTEMGVRAKVSRPVFEAHLFTEAIARAVGINVPESGMDLVLKPGITATTTIPDMRGSTLVFSLAGEGTLEWRVNAAEVAAALAGKDQSAFETIIASFEGIAKSEARIAPFWRKTFPPEAPDIRVIIKPAGQ